jgi:hypothetical protein
MMTFINQPMILECWVPGNEMSTSITTQPLSSRLEIMPGTGSVGSTSESHKYTLTQALHRKSTRNSNELQEGKKGRWTLVHRSGA